MPFSPKTGTSLIPKKDYLFFKKEHCLSLRKDIPFNRASDSSLKWGVFFVPKKSMPYVHQKGHIVCPSKRIFCMAFKKAKGNILSIKRAIMYLGTSFDPQKGYVFFSFVVENTCIKL